MTVWPTGHGNHDDTPVIDLGADMPVPQPGGGACRCFGGVLPCIEVLFEVEHHREHENEPILASVRGGPLGVVGRRVGRQALDKLGPDPLGVLLRRVQRRLILGSTEIILPRIHARVAHVPQPTAPRRPSQAQITMRASSLLLVRFPENHRNPRRSSDTLEVVVRSRLCVYPSERDTWRLGQPSGATGYGDHEYTPVIDLGPDKSFAQVRGGAAPR